MDPADVSMTSSSRLVTDRWVRGQTVTDRWDPHDVSMTSPIDKWVQRLYVADLWDQSTVSSGRAQTGPVGPGYGLGFGPPRGMLWCCHVIAKGLHWASVHTAWLMVDLCSWSLDCRLGLWWTESISLSPGMVEGSRWRLEGGE